MLVFFGTSSQAVFVYLDLDLDLYLYSCICELNTWECPKVRVLFSFPYIQPSLIGAVHNVNLY